MPQVYGGESLVLLAVLRTLWWLSYPDLHDWHRRSAIGGADMAGDKELPVTIRASWRTYTR